MPAVGFVSANCLGDEKLAIGVSPVEFRADARGGAWCSDREATGSRGAVVAQKLDAVCCRLCFELVGGDSSDKTFSVTTARSN